MFKKPPNVKNFSVIRSSDRKKIIQRITQLYGFEDVDQDAKNDILPDGAQSAKFTTYLEEPGILYYDAQGLEPLWMKIIPPSYSSELFVPTGIIPLSDLDYLWKVYTLWKWPSLLHTVTTWDHVIVKLQGGADLMTPGLNKWDFDIKSGDITAVTLENGVPIAVGVAAFDIGLLSKAAGEKGKAIYLLHCYNDELWALGSKSHPPTDILPNKSGRLEETLQELSLESEAQEDAVPTVLIEKNPEDQPHDVGDDEPSVTEIDNAFKAAAIFGMYQIIASNAHSAVSFPLSSSTWVSSHLNPYLPESFAHYSFKKTSWKKAATFLKKVLEKEGLIKTKDRGGETVILSIKWDHKLITEFEPYQLAKETEKQQGKEEQLSAPSVRTIQVKEMFKPSGKALKAILESQSKTKDGLYNANQIRDILNEYISNNPDLVDPRNPRLIKIDYNLVSLLKSEDKHSDTLPRDKLLNLLLESSTSYYTMTTDSETVTRKGKPPKIHVVLEKRQGRKTITRFWGLEAFLIDPNGLVEELRNTCATSVSVGAMHGSSPKQPIMEVLIQGPQASAVVDVLEKRGVKKSFIVVEDKRK